MTKENFNEVVNQWYDPLYRFAHSLCKDSDNAMDLTQNAFQKLARKSHTLKDFTKVKSWLFHVVHREFIDEYRHAQRFPKTSIELVEPIPSENSVELDRALDAQDLLSALAQLDLKFRAPLSLFYLEEFSYKEIAETLQIPIGTVMSRLRRAKDHLRKLMEEGFSQNQPAHNTVQFPRKAKSG